MKINIVELAFSNIYEVLDDDGTLLFESKSLDRAEAWMKGKLEDIRSYEGDKLHTKYERVYLSAADVMKSIRENIQDYPMCCNRIYTELNRE